MIKQLQFDYWPIHRSDDVKNPLIEEGSLQDLLSTYWNDVECWPTIELSKEQMDKGSIQRTADIEIKENNILNLINTQRWVQDEEQIELSALMQLQSSNGKWKINFTLDVGDVPENDLNSFNDKFGIGCEKFHFKFNNEKLIVDQEIKAGQLYRATKVFEWNNNTPLVFEIEEYGYGSTNKNSTFTQGVKWTINERR